MTTDHYIEATYGQTCKQFAGILAGVCSETTLALLLADLNAAEECSLLSDDEAAISSLLLERLAECYPAAALAAAQL